eukprot:10971314-Alexandrium_andersonii.AAC.1
MQAASETGDMDLYYHWWSRAMQQCFALVQQQVTGTPYQSPVQHGQVCVREVDQHESWKRPLLREG